MAERKVDWPATAGYKLRLGQHYCGLAIERSEGRHRLIMLCTRSYGKSVIELLIHTTSFKKIWRAGKYTRLTKIQLKR